MVPIVVLLPTSKHVLNKTEEEQVYSESSYCFKENARILCSYANPLKSTTLTLLYPGKQLHHVLKFVAIISTMPLLLSFFQINKDLQDGRESVLP